MFLIDRAQACVVIPAYNEASGIYPLVKAITKLGYFVLVVDDGSQDDTAQKAEQAGATVLSYQLNRGKGSAMRLGIEYFLSQSQFQYCIFMDADGQHHPEELDHFVDLATKGARIIVGDRLHHPQGMPWIRRATNHLMSWLISIKARKKIADTQCGYRLFAREVLSAIQLNSQKFEIETEMLLKSAQTGFKIENLPISCIYHENLRSKIRPLQDTLRFLKCYFLKN